MILQNIKVHKGAGSCLLIYPGKRNVRELPDYFYADITIVNIKKRETKHGNCRIGDCRGSGKAREVFK